jgi:hypothetical protein
MKPRKKRSRRLWWAVSLLVVFVLGTAVVGWFREKQDVRIQREQ